MEELTIIIPQKLLLDTRINSTNKLIYGIIRSLSDSDDWFIIERNDVSWILDVNDNTITRAIKQLKEFGYMDYRKSFRSIKIKFIV